MRGNFLDMILFTRIPAANVAMCQQSMEDAQLFSPSKCVRIMESCLI